MSNVSDTVSAYIIRVDVLSDTTDRRIYTHSYTLIMEAQTVSKTLDMNYILR
jgi:hypothetical protein